MILFFPPHFFEATILKEGECEHRHERMTVKALPGSSLEVVEAEFLFQLLMSLLTNPSRLDGGGQGAQVGRDWQICEVVFLLAEARCSPISQASSPGRCCWPLSLIRCGGPSAVRTRTAANRALSLPFVPVRQLTVCHLASASMSSAGIDRISGRAAYGAGPELWYLARSPHSDRVHLEVTGDANRPGKLASRKPLTERRTEPVTGIR